MSKKKRAIGAGRMTAAVVAAVVAEIEAYGRGERTVQLSWSALSAYSGFSHVSLWKKSAIKAAFAQLRHSQRADATPVIKIRKAPDERIEALIKTVDELKLTIQTYDELWALYEYNMQRLGIDPDKLRLPLDRVPREVVRSQRLRSTQ